VKEVTKNGLKSRKSDKIKKKCTDIEKSDK